MEGAIQQIENRNENPILVKVIVILVVLALLSSIVVPTFAGYLDKVKDEKGYQAAQAVCVAAQTVADD